MRPKFKLVIKVDVAALLMFIILLIR